MMMMDALCTEMRDDVCYLLFVAAVDSLFDRTSLILLDTRVMEMTLSMHTVHCWACS